MKMVTNKKAQMNLSFGMIFSIILIVVFIAFAFYGIGKFLEFQETIKIKQFLTDLQYDIDTVWRGSQASQPKEYSLPKKILEVCFRDDTYENLYFKSDKFIEGKLIDHIDTESLSVSGDLCFENTNNKINLILRKEFGKTLVIIEKP